MNTRKRRSRPRGKASQPTRLAHRRAAGAVGAVTSGDAWIAAPRSAWATARHAAAGAPPAGASPGTCGGRLSSGRTARRRNTLPAWSSARRPDAASGFLRRSPSASAAAVGWLRWRASPPGAVGAVVTYSVGRWSRSRCGAGCCGAPRRRGVRSAWVDKNRYLRSQRTGEVDAANVLLRRGLRGDLT